jgi:glycosyltransferase involved in cell wall biosynthesis
MRKNILILAHSYGLPFIESCNQYTQLFDSRHYDVTVAYLAGQPDEHIRQKTLAQNVLFLGCKKSSIRGLKIAAIYKVLQLCRKKRFAMVICHRYKPTYIMLWVAQFYKIPALICVMHAMGTMQSVWRRLFITALAKKTTLFAGVSNAVRDDMRDHLRSMSPDRIITLYNTIDYPLFEPRLLSRVEARQQLNLPEDSLVFGHIGRLAPEKDQATLISAFSQVADQYPQAKLIIIGPGDLEATLKQQAAALGLQDRVILTGYIADGFRLMKAFDAFVLSSIKESFGRVLLEAMVARVPVIATKTDGIPEVVGDAGFLVEARQPEKLAATMLLVLNTPATELTQLGEKGYQRMLSHFSVESIKKYFWQLPLLARLTA